VKKRLTEGLFTEKTTHGGAPRATSKAFVVLAYRTFFFALTGSASGRSKLISGLNRLSRFRPPGV